MLEENQDAICTALAEDLRKPFAEAAIGEVYEVLGQTSYMDKNLENFTKVEKIPTPLHQKPLSFEVGRRGCVAPCVYAVCVPYVCRTYRYK